MQFEWREGNSGVWYMKAGVLDVDLARARKIERGKYGVMMFLGKKVDLWEIPVEVDSMSDAKTFAEKRLVELIELIQETRWVTLMTTTSGEPSDAGTE